MVEKAHKEDVDLNNWFQQDLQTRAITIGDVAFKAQAAPNQMTPEDWFMLGLGSKDPEAIAVLQEDANARSHGIDWDDMFTPEAAMSSMQATGVSGVQVGQYWKSYTSGGAAHMHSWVDDAVATGTKVGIVTAVAASVILSGVAVAAGAGWMIGSVSGMAAGMGGAGWMSSTAGMTTMLMAMNNVGFSRVLTMLRIHGPNAIVKASGISAGTAVGFESLDALNAAFGTDPNSLDERTKRNVLLADLQKQGYEIEVAGQALEEGAILAIDDPTKIIIRDPDGNVISSEDKDALLDGGEIPSEFSDENSEVPITVTDTTTGTIPPGSAPGTIPVFGTGQQFSPVGTLSGGEVDLAEAFAAAELGTEDERLQAGRDKREREYAQDPFIGVGRTYYRNTDPQPYTDTSIGRRGNLTPDAIDYIERQRSGPVYRASDLPDEIASWSSIDILNFQDRAIEAGLINPDTTKDGRSFSPGTLDQFTIDALDNAMGQANINGDKQTYDDAMDGLIKAREEFEEKFGDKEKTPVWTPSRGYEAPDYASISQNVKTMFSRSLGRDPNGWEMDLLADSFRGDHRANYDQDMGMEQAAFEARGRAQETGEVEIPPSATDIDPIARMGENFDDQFSDELDAKSRWADVQSKSANLFGSFDKLSR